MVFNSEGCDWLTCLNAKCRRQWNPFHDDMNAAHSDFYPTFIEDVAVDGGIRSPSDLDRFIDKHHLVANALGLDYHIKLMENALAEDRRADFESRLAQLPSGYGALIGYFSRMSEMSAEYKSVLEDMNSCSTFDQLCNVISHPAHVDQFNEGDVALVKQLWESKNRGTPPFILLTKVRAIESYDVKQHVKRTIES